MNQNSFSSFQGHSPHGTQTERKDQALNWISEWVAPIIAWAALIALGLAIAGFLLGEE
ncbi:MAG: hypothetical protein WA628_05490 [Terriglobales bacterium]